MILIYILRYDLYNPCVLVSLSSSVRLCRPISVQYLFGTFAGLIEMSTTIQRSLDQLVPSGLNTEQQVFNENHILLQARKTELRACLLQSQDLFSVCVHLIHKHLNRHTMLFVSFVLYSKIKINKVYLEHKTIITDKD